MIGIFSKGMRRIPHLRTLLGEEIRFRPSSPKGLRAVAGWGLKPTSEHARAMAARWGLPYLAVEDGFYRSLGLGVAGAPPLSVVVDDLGIYYDSTRPSALEAHLGGADFTTQELERARRAMDVIRHFRLSKYNHAPELPCPFPDDGRRRVLVVDQTCNDVSVTLGQADADSFARMLREAIDDNQGAHIAVKVHPDVLSGRKQGYLPGPLPQGAVILAEDRNPVALLEQVDAVYTVSSQLGFEALLLGREVHCFGLPFYAGWGLTRDRLCCERRRPGCSVEQVFAAACMRYARYVDPCSGKRCDIETALERLADQKRHNDRNRGVAVCAGFSAWRRGFARYFLQSTDGEVRFAPTKEQAVAEAKAAGGRVVVWAPKAPAGVRELCSAEQAPLAFMEDGFLRSSGLGSDFHWPYSLSLDASGIYYDPGAPSDMETLLRTAEFHPSLIERASRLRQSLVEGKVTKYNVGREEGPPQLGRPGRDTVLVVGQVEDDASVVTGGLGLHSDTELLQAVRSRRPKAWIVYKPHPDVASGNRRGGAPAAALGELFDQQITHASLTALFPVVDELHTLTSLSGFEALLRGIPVHTYGGPFYAGWGLTHDRQDFPRRGRRLQLDELVAGALILYPSYFDWRTQHFCGPEVVLERLRSRETPRQGRGVRAWCRLVHASMKLRAGLRRGG